MKNYPAAVKSGLCLLVFAFAYSLSHASQLGKEMNDADDELNVVYANVLSGLPSPELKEQLRVSQRAWVAFKDAEVALHANLYPESKGGLFTRLELTEQRIKQLKSIGERTSGFGYDQGQ